MDPTTIDLAYQDFRQWLQETLAARADIIGPLAEDERSSPQRREVRRIVAGMESAYNRAFERMQAGTAPADINDRFIDEIEISKRDILAVLSGASGGSGESNLHMLAGIGLAAFGLWYITRK